MSAIHPKRIALLHVAKRQLKMTDADYRALLERVAGVASASDLSDLAFERAMIELNRLGFRSSSAKRGFGHRPGFASPSQLALARKLWRQYHGDDPNETAFNAWLTRFHQVSALRFVTSERAGPVLIALKAMAGRPARAS